MTTEYKNPHAGPAAKSNEIAQALSRQIAHHVDDPTNRSFKQVWQSACDDKRLMGVIKQRFKKSATEDMMKGVIKSVLINRYDVGRIALHHADFYRDTQGAPVDSIPAGVLNSIADLNPRDAKLLAQIEIAHLQKRVDHERRTILERKAASLHYPALAIEDKTDKQDKLRKAYFKFHLVQAQRDKPLDYQHRLGEFYYDLSFILSDRNDVLDFAKRNFDLLIQPPQSLLPDGKPYERPHSLEDVARFIRNTPNAKRPHLRDQYHIQAARLTGQPTLADYPNKTSADSLAQKMTLAARVDKKPAESDPAQSRQLARQFQANESMLDTLYDLGQQLGGLKNLTRLVETMAHEHYVKPKSNAVQTQPN